MTGSKRRIPAWTSVVVGAVVGGIGLLFVVRTLVVEAPDVRDAIGGGNLWYVPAALVTAGAGMVAVALPWRSAIALLGGRLDRAEVVARYFSGELGKYVPGSVWAVVGRGELARRRGVDAAAAYGSVGLSLLGLYLAALLVAAVTLPAALASGSDRRPWLLLLLLPIGLLALHHAVTERLVLAVERVRGRPLDLSVPSWRQALGLVVRYVPAWLLIGTSTWFVVLVMGGGVGWPEVLFATTLSWFAGFAAVPVPGGVGVREAVFVALTPELDGGVSAAAALTARLLFVLVDGVGAAAASAWLARRLRGRSDAPS